MSLIRVAFRKFSGSYQKSAERHAQMLCTNRLQNRYRNQFGWRLITG
ncbi:hypothetical protein FEAC_09960 [Ferrimicrobium acidiphilum DSM 19497]|uniref:Uncharacterized protein n=1 Tax=Ferrimicrobium acidiphilum DSM 19497 TaxID=1121877 RepID=A0A0D8FYB7_9ACTN|nr:hypothetical protein FEAC_09960 [Ferrimicrobium acidiphilum DSM 19497]